jgi:hypothetical protein
MDKLEDSNKQQMQDVGSTLAQLVQDSPPLSETKFEDLLRTVGEGREQPYHTEQQLSSSVPRSPTDVLFEAFAGTKLGDDSSHTGHAGFDFHDQLLQLAELVGRESQVNYALIRLYSILFFLKSCA